VRSVNADQFQGLRTMGAVLDQVATPSFQSFLISLGSNLVAQQRVTVWIFIVQFSTQLIIQPGDIKLFYALCLSEYLWDGLHLLSCSLRRGHTILTSRELMWYYVRSWDVRGDLTLNSMTRIYSSFTLLTSRHVSRVTEVWICAI
jgi:hypothetical protein